MGKLTTERFIEKAIKVHNNKYDYSNAQYISCKNKIEIICRKHGSFWQLPSSHLSGIGCPKCGYETIGNRTRKTTEQFIKDAKEVHGNKYDYSKANYINAHTKLCIICPEHGEFWQSSCLHITQKCGCSKCASNEVKKKLRSNMETFLNRAKKLHGDKYNYSNVNYMNSKAKVCIICPIHGEFCQRVETHLIGQGCPKCGKKRQSDKLRMTNEEFIIRSNKVHKNRYSYTRTNYMGYCSKVIITCPIHGDFEQIAYNHLQGKGCSKCRKSKLEIEMTEFLNKNNIYFLEQIRPKYLSNGKSHLSLDFYLPDYNIAIECQGKQHFTKGTFFDKRTETIAERDKRKYNLCKKNGVRIFYYSFMKPKKYIDNVYINKEELLQDIIYYGKE